MTAEASAAQVALLARLSMHLAYVDGLCNKHTVPVGGRQGEACR